MTEPTAWRPRVGTDLTDVAEVAASIEHFGDRYLHRIWTDDELSASAGPDRARRLAARFAAKEATAKVLGAPDVPLPWRSIEVVRDSSGRPALVLHSEAAAVAAAAGLAQFDVSLSHERDLALAVVTAIQQTRPAPDRADGRDGQEVM
jgi:holo-[acyl-carrier protein] synthase